MPYDLPFTILDVFAEQPFEGNALAVFHDGRDLSPEQMQAIARETNLSETTFVLPGETPEIERIEGVRVRIFTTQEELPFAGHPTLGTAAWLRLHHPAFQDANIITLRLAVGPIPVRFEHGVAGNGLFGSMRQHDPEFGAVHDTDEVARVLGLNRTDLLRGVPVQSVSTGNPFCIVPLRSLDVLARLRIPERNATTWLRQRDARWFYCIAPDPDGIGWRARMQWEQGEDPATGSAAGPCIAWLVRHGLVRPGVVVRLLQGVEIRRRSELFVQASLAEGRVVDVHVAGRTIPVATGRFFARP